MRHPRAAFSLLVVTTLSFLLCTGNVEAKHRNINTWCKSADYRALCSRMVGASMTQDEAIRNAVQASLAIISRVAPQYRAHGLAHSNLPEEVISTCQESFTRAIENLKEASMIGNDRSTVLDRIQVSESGFFDCRDMIQKQGAEADFLGKTTNILFKFASNALAVATQM